MGSKKMVICLACLRGSKAWIFRVKDGALPGTAGPGPSRGLFRWQHGYRTSENSGEKLSLMSEGALRKVRLSIHIFLFSKKRVSETAKKDREARICHKWPARGSGNKPTHRGRRPRATNPLKYPSREWTNREYKIQGDPFALRCDAFLPAWEVLFR